MKFALRIIVISILGYLSSLFLPWWCTVVACALVGFMMPGNDVNVFISGLVAIGVLWIFQAWQHHVLNDGLIANEINELFNYDDPVTFIIYAGVIGAALGSLGAITGNSLRKIYIKDKKKRFYS